MSRRAQNPVALLARCPECQRGPGRPCVDIGRHILRHAHGSRYVAGNSFAQRALARVDADFEQRLAEFRARQAEPEPPDAPEPEPESPPPELAVLERLERTIDQWERREEGVGC